MVCDKCQKMLMPEDDVLLVASFALAAPDFILMGPHRHLLPTDEGCEGSPSSAQYLEGQPRDTRKGYKYHQPLEQPMRRAYVLLQKAVTKLGQQANLQDLAHEMEVMSMV